MYNDDTQVGQILTRREALSLFGAGGLALLAACSGSKSSSSQATATAAPASPAAQATSPQTASATTVPASASAAPACIVRPALTEGPYFVDEKLNRADIRSDPSDGSVRPGVPLVLTFNVASMASNACAGLAGAVVDVWHCDAQGVYSDARDQGFNTIGKKFLRGSLVTDATGKAQFTTIYPGWYQGRAVHIHFKIRTLAANGKTNEFTSQLFFDEPMNDSIFANAPYVKSGRRTQNSQDGIYRDGGAQRLLQPVKNGDGLGATFDIGLQL
jgi:protocatechuate 3,4-dioxygenase beta subunit